MTVDGDTDTITVRHRALTENPMAGMITDKFEIKVSCSQITPRSGGRAEHARRFLACSAGDHFDRRGDEMVLSVRGRIRGSR